MHNATVANNNIHFSNKTLVLFLTNTQDCCYILMWITKVILRELSIFLKWCKMFECLVGQKYQDTNYQYILNTFVFITLVSGSYAFRSPIHKPKYSTFKSSQVFSTIMTQTVHQFRCNQFMIYATSSGVTRGINNECVPLRQAGQPAGRRDVLTLVTVSINST